MRFVIFISALIFTVAANAFFWGSPEQVQYTKAQMAELETFKNKIKTERVKQESFKREIAEAKKSRACTGSSSAELRACADKFDTVDAKITDAQAEVEATAAKIKLAEDAHAAKVKEFTQKYEDEKMKIAHNAAVAENQKVLEKQAKEKAATDARELSRDITLEYAKLGYRAGTTQMGLAMSQLEIQRMYGKLDRSNLGAYMTDRMTKVLNSNVFCEAQKQCSTKASNIKPTDLQNIFSGTSPAPASEKEKAFNKALSAGGTK